MTAATSPLFSTNRCSILSSCYRAVRRQTLELCQPLTPEDMMVQSCPEASPAKWHLAHTAWFFESFVLKEFFPGYRAFNDDFTWLFNSYYQTFSAFPEKRLRSSFSRPALDEILRYREHVDLAMEQLFERDLEDEALRRIELGVNHEEQHQELLLTDILNAFYTNPLKPTYREKGLGLRGQKGSEPLSFKSFEGGLQEAGYSGAGFCYDNELPRHKVWLEPFALANRLVTCGEYAEFIADAGYRRPELWLSAGWDAVQQNGWRAPLYWNDREGGWSLFTLRGEFSLSEVAAVPVSQVSYYEADAYARWAGHRLPTEFEWEVAAAGLPVEGNLLDSAEFMPVSIPHAQSTGNNPMLRTQNGGQCFGDCWVWTSSAYLGYPGFRPLAGTLGEYNGKFMSGQMVLRGGSCVTPARHIRATYRNFFAPEIRWQFSGIRLVQ